MRILVTGASGSGTTTLGSTLAGQLGCKHFDLDDYFWLPTTPPFQRKRDPAERLQMLSRDLLEAPRAMVSGSPMGWGVGVEDAFDLVVFLHVPTTLRLERLQRREVQRYGKADTALLLWASQYDEGPPEGRSLSKHLAWLARRSCPVLRMEGDSSIDAQVELVLKTLAAA